MWSLGSLEQACLAMSQKLNITVASYHFKLLVEKPIEIQRGMEEVCPLVYNAV